MMTKEVSTKIVNVITPEAGVLMLGRGQISHSEYVLSSTLAIYSMLMAIVYLRYTQVTVNARGFSL